MVKKFAACMLIAALVPTSIAALPVNAEEVTPIVSQASQSKNIFECVRNDSFRRALELGDLKDVKYCRGQLLAETKAGSSYDAANNTAVGSVIAGMDYYFLYEVGSDDMVYITGVEYPISYNGMRYMEYVNSGGDVQELPFDARFSDATVRKYFDEDVDSYYHVNVPSEVDGKKVAGITSNVSDSLSAVNRLRYDGSGKELKVVKIPTVKISKGDVDGDGDLTSSDALAILRFTVGSSDSPDSNIADFDGDGNITSADALAVLRKTVGL